MSKGNTLIPVRFPPALLARMDDQIAQLAATSADTPPDRSMFIRRAVERDLAHYSRSRRSRCPRPHVWGKLPKGGRR